MVKPKISYLIACTPRTGSWLLAYALQDTGVAGKPDEYFATGIESYWCELAGIEPPRSGGSYRSYLNAIFRFGTSSNGTFGAKLLWQFVGTFSRQAQALPEYKNLEIPRLLPRVFPGLRIILLQRSDKVRAAISYWRASTSGVWAVDPDGTPAWRSPAEPLRPRFDVQIISELHAKAHAEQDAWEHLAAATSAPCLVVEYEDLVAAWDKTLREVLTFLGCEPALTTSMPQPRLAQQADEESGRYAAAWQAATGGCPSCQHAAPNAG